jgi:hypothetical protein
MDFLLICFTHFGLGKIFKNILIKAFSFILSGLTSVLVSTTFLSGENFLTENGSNLVFKYEIL